MSDNNVNKATSISKYGFVLSTGWIQTTKSGNSVYANKNKGHGKVLGGANAFARANKREIRPTDKFPENPKGISDTIFYHCLRHDYVFFPHDFTDINGVERKGGYYDEEGNYYVNVRILYNPQSDGAVCKYCGHNTVFDVNHQNMEDLWCSQCGAEINYFGLLDKDCDFLVFSNAFYSAKVINPEQEILTQYVPPVENESYRKPLEERRKELRNGRDNPYLDYIRENFGESDIPDEEIKGFNTEELQYIKAREYKPEAVKKWEPNVSLIIESNVADKTKCDEPRRKYDDVYAAKSDPSVVKIVKPIVLDDDEPLQYIKSRKYNPEPVKKWERNPSESERRKYGGNILNPIVLDDNEPLQYIKTREYNPEPVKEWKPLTEQNNIATSRNISETDDGEESLSVLNFDEPLQHIKTREYNPKPVVSQTYEPHKYQTVQVPYKEYQKQKVNHNIEQVENILEDIMENFTLASYIMEKFGGEGVKLCETPSEEEESWKLRDDVDYSIFRRDK